MVFLTMESVEEPQSKKMNIAVNAKNNTILTASAETKRRNASVASKGSHLMTTKNVCQSLTKITKMKTAMSFASNINGLKLLAINIAKPFALNVRTDITSVRRINAWLYLKIAKQLMKKESARLVKKDTTLIWKGTVS